MFTKNLDTLKPSQLEMIAAALFMAATTCEEEDFAEIYAMYEEVEKVAIGKVGERTFYWNFRNSMNKILTTES